MSACINSGLHIEEGEVLVEIPAYTVTCSMCGATVNLNLCVDKNQIGFHYKDHEMQA